MDALLLGHGAHQIQTLKLTSPANSHPFFICCTTFYTKIICKVRHPVQLIVTHDITL